MRVKSLIMEKLGHSLNKSSNIMTPAEIPQEDMDYAASKNKDTTTGNEGVIPTSSKPSNDSEYLSAAGAEADPSILGAALELF